MEFLSWRRSKILAEAGRDGGRLKGQVPLAMKDTATGVEVTDNVPVYFTAAGEVAGLNPSAIRHLAPRPSTPDAETTKFVHIDFHDHDLPWRYSPRAVENVAERLFFPWMVLIVGTGEELAIEGSIVSRVETAVLEDHKLTSSHLWGHVQREGGTMFSRLISPRVLLPQRQYVAALVPTLDAAGEFRWTDQGLQGGPLPAFHSWRFWTADEGDFKSLATALKLRKAGDLGTTEVHYSRPVAGVNVTLDARGAITSLQEPTPDVPGDLNAARADLDDLNDEIPDDGEPERDIIEMPSYGRPWHEDPDTFVWGRTLNDDPRHRGIAGLGAWMAQLGQESLMDAAVTQAGALQDAAERIRQLAIGLDAARRLWLRRLPDADALRLRLFGPAMGRMLAEGGGTVLARVTSAGSVLDAAMFSSAAQRLLRDGSARARFSANGRVDRTKVLAAANQPIVAPDKTPAGTPHVDGVAADLGQRPLEDALGLPSVDDRRLERVIAEFVGRPNEPQIVAEFANRLSQELRLGCHDHVQGFLADLAGMVSILERGILLAAIDRCLAQMLDGRLEEAGLGVVLPPRPTTDPRQPINLGALADAVSSAIDPTQPEPPAWIRVISTITKPTVTTLAPLEAPIGLDYPTWTLLNTHARDWLLPGVDSLPPDSIVALRTNPKFIDAFMVGINTQFLAEMRWRNLPAPRVSTPLRMFWGYVNHDSGKREADIQPIANWPSKPPSAIDPDDLGSLTHQATKPGDETGKEDLVIAFRTPLFRRYPSTLVYLVRPLPGDDVDTVLKQPPNFQDAPTNRAQRRCFGPIFFGEMMPDLVFFAFDVTPSTLDQFWLVLDEPPSELRFRTTPGFASSTAAQCAASTIDKPTRVAISGKALEDQALDQ